MKADICELGRPPGYLYFGMSLAEGQQWNPSRPGMCNGLLSPALSSFLRGKIMSRSRHVQSVIQATVKLCSFSRRPNYLWSLPIV
jgi:hypothetical protein